MASDLTEMVLAAGALGTAAFGIVDGLKGTAIGAAGFAKLSKMLGPIHLSLAQAYGDNYQELMEAQYRDGRGAGSLPRTLRQGVRIGLTQHNADEISRFVGKDVVDGSTLADIAGKIADGTTLTDGERSILGRFELAVDTRIDAAIALAEQKYTLVTRWWASGIAIVLALIAAWALSLDAKTFDLLFWTKDLFIKGLIVGLVAVPLAPIAKDIASALQSATKAIKTKQ